MHIYNTRFNPSNFIANTNIHTYYRSNNRLKFSERISLLCKKIFQSSLHPFFTYINRDQFQSQWREIFWGRKEIVISKRTRTQETFDNPKDENKLLVTSLAAIEEIGTSTIQPSNPLPFPQEEFKLSFQDETSLIIPSSQLSLLMEKSPYFKSLWSGNFQETLRDPLTLTQKEFIHLLNCLMDANFKVSEEDIPSFIQLADYYQLTEVVKNLGEQLLDIYKSKKFELFNSSEDSLVELKEVLNFARQYQLNTLKNYLELTVVSSLLNQTSQLTEFEKILKHFSNEIERLDFLENDYLTDTHLLVLKNCKNLKELYLQRCHNLTDAGLAHLAPLLALQHLDLSECNNLTDAGLAHLTPLMALQHLNLSYCKNLTDAGLAHLTPLVALQYLDLSGCDNLTDAGLAHLTPLMALQHLGLSACDKLTDAGLAHLTPLVALQYLSLNGCDKLTDVGLAHLTPLVALTHLNLSWCDKLTDAGLAHLTPLVALQHLNLRWCRKLTDAGLAHLTPLVALQHLDLNRCPKLTDAGLAHLTSLVNLRHLNLSYCRKLTDVGLAHLTPLVALQHLNLSCCRKLTDAGLAHLASLLALQHLDLSGCDKLTDAVLE